MSSDEGDDVELSLLTEEDRRAAATDLTLEEEQAYLAKAESKAISSRDKQAMVLLTILCA